MFDRVLNTSMKFMWYDKSYVMLDLKKHKLHKSNDDYCLGNVIRGRDINQKPYISIINLKFLNR